MQVNKASEPKKTAGLELRRALGFWSAVAIIIGTAIGALTLGVVRQGLFFIGIDYDWYQAILGLMLLVAVVINQFTRRNVVRG